MEKNIEHFNLILEFIGVKQQYRYELQRFALERGNDFIEEVEKRIAKGYYSGALLCSFSFQESKEGKEFWLRINNILSEYTHTRRLSLPPQGGKQER